MEIKKVGVVGAGTMGNGIAHVFAQYGYEVILVDVLEDALKRAIETISRNLDRQIKKGVIKPEDKEVILKRIKPTIHMEDLSEADFVVEAVVEDEDIKKDVFLKLDEVTRPEVILSSNTSSISITKLSKITHRPDKVVGMHFMNPVPVMKLVEVVKGFLTSDETVKFVVELAEKLEKVPVVVNDYPGFVSNRVLMPMINEAIFALQEGVADKEAIDTVMKLGMKSSHGSPCTCRFDRAGCGPLYPERPL